MNDNCFTQSIRMRLCTNLRHRRDGTGELPAVALRLLLAMGEIRGTPCMRRNILVHRATTKISANSFAFRSKIEKEGLPRGSTSVLETSAQRLVGKLTHLHREQVCCFSDGPWRSGWSTSAETSRREPRGCEGILCARQSQYTGLGSR